MICENDKLNIPEEYKKMSVSELRRRKEYIYMGIKQNTKEEIKKVEHKNETVTFHF